MRFLTTAYSVPTLTHLLQDLNVLLCREGKDLPPVLLSHPAALIWSLLTSLEGFPEALADLDPSSHATELT